MFMIQGYYGSYYISAVCVTLLQLTLNKRFC